MKNTLHRVCCGAYVLLSAELYLVAGLPPGSRGTATVLVYAGLTLLMFAVWRLEKKHQVDSGPWVLGAALLARAVTFFVPGFLSHDIDRYLWDGAVALEGLDPYSVAAEDPLLIELRSRWPTPEEHLQYPTLYPPLALTLFAGCAAMGPEFAPWGWRLLVLAASVVILLAARRLSEQLENRSAFVFVAFSPLLLVEGQVGAHLDLFVAAAVAVALLALAGGRPRSGTTALALGAAIKLLPAGALGVWWVRRGVRRSLGLVAIAAVLFLGPYLAAFLFGWVPVGSISVFFEKWRFASPLWLGLEGVFGERMGAVALAGAAISALFALWLARNARDGSVLIFAVALPLVWSPVVFPWYLAPLVPLLLLRRSNFLLGWLCTIPLTYEVLDRFDLDGTWEPAAWPVAIVAAAWGVGLAFDLRSGARQGVPFGEFGA